ncbi:MAG: HNH endonuclease, partial [Bacteroidetes bacterium]|nr:HNH endonuclease [Bacteroidota bacterium]
TKDGGSWSEETKKAVWNKGRIYDDSHSADTFRRDKCGKGIYWSDYGNRNDSWGWEIDHINPVANGGGDELSNLQPLQWENNANKSDKLNWTCP